METLPIAPFWQKLGLVAGALCTLAMFSFLWRENAIYRLFEHIFVGLGVGYTVAVTWTDVLKPNWWDRLVWAGTSPALQAAEEVRLFDRRIWLMWGDDVLPLWGLLGVAGLLWFFQLSQKRAWLSRIVVGLIMGTGSGLIFRRIAAYFFTDKGQVTQSFKPLLVRADGDRLVSGWNHLLIGWGMAFVIAFLVWWAKRESRGGGRAHLAVLAGLSALFLSALGLSAVMRTEGLLPAWDNILITVTLISSLYYFIYLGKSRAGALRGIPLLGRWLLMISFGATFGSTVMGRLSLLIDRAHFLLVQCLGLGG